MSGLARPLSICVQTEGFTYIAPCGRCSPSYKGRRALDTGHPRKRGWVRWKDAPAQPVAMGAVLGSSRFRLTCSHRVQLPRALTKTGLGQLLSRRKCSWDTEQRPIQALTLKGGMGLEIPFLTNF